MSSNADPADASVATDSGSHPKGLATIFFTEMWERFSYYGMRAFLVLFLTAPVTHGGLGASPSEAGSIYGLYTAGVYLCAMPGGWVADKLLGLRRAVVWGGLLITLGNLVLAFGTNFQEFCLGLLVIALGTGLLKSNASCLVGELYRGQSSSRRDSGFSIYYMGINLGAFLAPFAAGTLGETVGYRWGFGLSSVAMLLGLIQYAITESWLGNVGARPVMASNRSRHKAIGLLLAGCLFIALVVTMAAEGWMMLDPVRLAQFAGFGIVAIATFVIVATFWFGDLTGTERRNVAAIVVIVLFSALFWAGYEQAGSSLNLFARDFTDRSCFGKWFIGGQHPASWYQSVQPIAVLLLAPMFAWLWIALARRSQDPSAPSKFGLALLQLAASFFVMVIAVKILMITHQKVSPNYLVLTYVLQTTGELCLSPIGMSTVSALAPKRLGARLMATLFLGIAMGNLAAGLIGGNVTSGAVAAMPQKYLWMSVVTGGAGVLMLCIASRVRALMTFEDTPHR